MDQPPRDRSPSLEEFQELLSPVVGIEPETLRPTDRLVHDLRLDELMLARLVLAIEDVNPYFALPDQLDIEDVTVADLHHFCCVMGPGHVEPGADTGGRLLSGSPAS